MRVSKWGNSLAVRLPKTLVEKMGLRAGDELNIVDVVERTLVVRRKTGARPRLSAWPPATGYFLPATNSIGTRRTSAKKPPIH